MRIRTILLCDAATVREGLLNVLSAGITMLYRDTFPAGVAVQAAILFDFGPDDYETDHPMQLTIRERGGQQLLVQDARFRIGQGEERIPDEIPAMVSVIVAFSDAPLLPHEGIYELVVQVGDLIETAPFWAGPRGGQQFARSQEIMRAQAS